MAEDVGPNLSNVLSGLTQLRVRISGAASHCRYKRDDSAARLRWFRRRSPVWSSSCPGLPREGSCQTRSAGRSAIVERKKPGVANVMSQTRSEFTVESAHQSGKTL